MRYALNLAEDNRILSACIVLKNGNYSGMPIVDELPEGNICEYLYTDNEYIHDPLPVEEVVTEPTEIEDLSALVVEQEYRITLLELGITE